MTSKMAAKHKGLVIKAVYYSAKGDELFKILNIIFVSDCYLDIATMDDCFFRDVLECGDDSGPLSNAGKARIDTIIKCS